VNVDGIVAEIDELVLVHGDDKSLLGDFLDGVSFGDVDVDAGLKNGCGDHEDDEEDEDDIDERNHVDVGERGLGGFGQLRHGGSVTSSQRPATGGEEVVRGKKATIPPTCGAHQR